MSFHLRTTQAIFIRKVMVGVASFVFIVLALHGLADLKLIAFPAQNHFSVYLFVGLFAAAAALLVKPADHAAKRVLRDYVMRNACYAHLVLDDLAEELLSILHLRELVNLVVNSFAETFRLKTVAFFVLRKGSDDFEAVSAYGWPAAELRRAKLSAHGLLAEILKKNGEHTQTRNILLKSVRWQDASNLELEFQIIRGGWVLPFLFKGQLIGFLSFGSESPDRTFEKADFKSFTRFARRVGVCLHNALEMETLTQMNEELQDVQSQRFQVSKLKAISQLAEGLGHEIHNPLAIISGKAQVLLFKKNEPDWARQTEETLSVIIQQSKRAADIIRKVLASVRESQSPPKEIDLRKVAVEAAQFLRYQVALKQIEIQVDAEEGLHFFAHPGDFYEIFSGLILNAVEMLGSHGWVRIQIRRMPSQEVVEILVTDSGPGLNSEMVEQVFDPFFKTRHEALGLGLFAVKHTVHRYGGSIRAESGIGKGVVFQIQLPLGRMIEPIVFDQAREPQASQTISERK